MPKITIVDKREIPSADPARVGKLDAMIVYRLDGFRSYLVTLPNEKLGGRDEDAVIAAAIKADLAERERFIGKEMEID